jgi:hypothetical protein
MAVIAVDNQALFEKLVDEARAFIEDGEKLRRLLESGQQQLKN